MRIMAIILILRSIKITIKNIFQKYIYDLDNSFIIDISQNVCIKKHNWFRDYFQIMCYSQLKLMWSWNWIDYWFIFSDHLYFKQNLYTTLIVMHAIDHLDNMNLSTSENDVMTSQFFCSDVMDKTNDSFYG